MGNDHGSLDECFGVGSSWGNGVAGNFGSTAAVVCLHLVDLN